jgi:hypothetical protein
MINLEKFAKIWAMTDSPNPHEAENARELARYMLDGEGKSFADVPDLLRAAQPKPVLSPYEGIFGTVKENAEKAATKRWEVVCRYGSAEAVLAPSVNEALLDAAVQHLKKRVRKMYHNGTFWTDSLAGWTGWSMARVSPPEVVKAVSEAYPLPATVDAAKLEKDFWDQRALDLDHFHGPAGGDDALSLAAQERRRIVDDLFWQGLRARDLREVIQRVEAIMNGEGCEPNGALETIKTDLEALA